MPKLLIHKRKKVNFMIDEEILERFEAYVPAGERSDFVNEAVEEALANFGRKKAFEFFKKFRKMQKETQTSNQITNFIKKEREKRTKKLGK